MNDELNVTPEETEKPKKSVLATLLRIFSVLLIIIACLITVVSVITFKTGSGDWLNLGEQVELPVDYTVDFYKAEFKTNSEADSWEYGCPASGLTIAADNDYFYVQNPAKNGELTKISKNSPYSSTVLCEQPAKDINVLNNKVYFVVPAGSIEAVPGIYSISTDGSDLLCLSEGSFENLIVINDWLYFIDSSNHFIKKMNINNRKHITVSEKDVQSFLIDNNYLYFEYSEFPKESETPRIYTLGRITVNGESLKTFATFDEKVSFLLDRQKIYFAGKSVGLGSLDIYSEAQDIYVGGELISRLGKSGNKLYYIDNLNEYSLSCYDLSTKNASSFNLKNASDFLLSDSIIITYYMEYGINPKVSVNDITTGKTVSLFE